MFKETSIRGKEDRKKQENVHAEEKKGRKKILFTWNHQEKAKQEKLTADKDRKQHNKSVPEQCIFLSPSLLQCVLYLEHTSRLHLFPVLAVSSWQ